MPPKDYKPLDLGAGTLYIAQEGEAPVPLGGIQEATLEPAEGGVVDPAIVKASISEDATLTASLDMQYEAYQELYMKPMREAIYQTYQGIRKCSTHFWTFLAYVKNGYFPNPRLVYIAAHGKNRRIRKKNIKRILRGD